MVRTIMPKARAKAEAVVDMVVLSEEPPELLPAAAAAAATAVALEVDLLKLAGSR